MKRSEAVTLLASGPGLNDGARLDSLAQRLGEWPLLLRLVNRQLRELMEDEGLGLEEAVNEIEDELDESGVTAFDVDHATSRNKAVDRTLDVSLRRLADDERQRFRELAVFPEDVDVPFDILEQFWRLRVKDVRKLCRPATFRACGTDDPPPRRDPPVSDWRARRPAGASPATARSVSTAERKVGRPCGRRKVRVASSSGAFGRKRRAG